MPKTMVMDVIANANFERYVIQRATYSNRFVRAGVVVASPEFDLLASGGGRTALMPFWAPLAGTRQTISDVADLTVSRIQAGQDIARIHTDGNAWSVNGLARLLAGEDPMKAIVAQLGDFWATLDEQMLISTLIGVFGAASMLGNVHDISAAVGAGAKISAEAFVDATAKLGDRGDELGAVAMHSAVEAYLRKQDLIDVIPGSEGKPMLKTFQGRAVIVDDQMPVDNGVYSTILFARGAVAKGSANLSGAPLEGGFGTEGTELARSPLAGDSLLINRRRHILHPRGVKWEPAGPAADASPEDADLATAANWTRVWEPKDVRMVLLKHRLTDGAPA